MNQRLIYQAIAAAVQSYHHWRDSPHERAKEFMDKFEDKALSLVKNRLPSGSGIDAGVTLDMDKSHANKLVFTFGFHHMDEHGFYDGWTEHTLIVTPCFEGHPDLKITGKNRGLIKEYLYDTFQYALTRMECEEQSTAKEKE